MVRKKKDYPALTKERIDALIKKKDRHIKLLQEKGAVIIRSGATGINPDVKKIRRHLRRTKHVRKRNIDVREKVA